MNKTKSYDKKTKLMEEGKEKQNNPNFIVKPYHNWNLKSTSKFWSFTIFKQPQEHQKTKRKVANLIWTSKDLSLIYFLKQPYETSNYQSLFLISRIKQNKGFIFSFSFFFKKVSKRQMLNVKKSYMKKILWQKYKKN